MSELSSISDSPIKSPSPKLKEEAKELTLKVNSGWEGLNDEEMFLGTTKSPIAQSLILAMPPSTSNKRFTFGENLSISHASSVIVHPRSRVAPPLAIERLELCSIEPQKRVYEIIRLGHYEIPSQLRPRRPCTIESSPVACIHTTLRPRRTMLIGSAERRDPVEEYFVLMTQAIKLDSPYLDKVARVSPSDLYKRAVNDNVPFCKWYGWIEAQLKAAYAAQNHA